jgi:DNA-binding NtrC family response regulator
MPSVKSRLTGWLRREPKVVVPRSILVVDSNTNDRRATAGRVSRLGYEALEANSAAEAVRQLEEHDPEFVLLAFDLSDAHDLQGLEKVRDVAPEVPVIMLAPNYHDARAAEAMRRGALAYLGKPFGQDDLRELLTRR